MAALIACWYVWCSDWKNIMLSAKYRVMEGGESEGATIA